MDLLNNGYYNSQAVQVLNAVEYDEFDNPIGLYESPSDPSSCNFTVTDNSRCKFVDSNCFQGNGAGYLKLSNNNFATLANFEFDLTVIPLSNLGSDLTGTFVTKYNFGSSSSFQVNRTDSGGGINLNIATAAGIYPSPILIVSYNDVTGKKDKPLKLRVKIFGTTVLTYFNETLTSSVQLANPMYLVNYPFALAGTSAGNSVLRSVWKIYDFNLWELDASGDRVSQLSSLPLCEPIINPSGHIYHDVSGNGNHATLINGSVGNEGKQNEFHYLQNGFNIHENRFSYSEDFSNVYWAPRQCTKTLSQIDFDGGNNAVMLTVSVGATDPELRVTNTTDFNSASVCEVYAKAGTASNVYIRNFSGGLLVTFNLLTNVITPTTIFPVTTSPNLLGEFNITDVGNGWKLCRLISYSFGNANSNLFSIGMYATVGQTIYLYKPWLYKYDLSRIKNYIKTTTTSIIDQYSSKHLTNNTDYLGNPLEFQQDGKSFLPSGCYLQQYSTNTNLKTADSTVGLWYGPEGDPYKVSYNTLCLQDPWNEQVFIGNKTKDYKLGPISTHYNNLTSVQKLTERVVRNVVDDPLIEDPAFSHDVTVAAGDLTYSLRNISGQVFNAIVDWGDGTTQSVNTVATQNITKTYSAAGTYTIRVTGIMTWCYPGDVSLANALKVTKINNWGQCNVYRLSFSACQNIISIPNGPITGLRSNNDISSLFNVCYNLTGTIPDNLLMYATTSTNAVNLFNGCSKLTGQIPENLFRYCPNLTSVASAFQNCAGLTGQIPEELLKYNTKLTAANDLFYGCTGLSGSIPEDLLRYNPLISIVRGLFRGCSGLVGAIPSTLLTYNTEIANVSQLFYGCSKLTNSIPESLFYTNTKISTFDSVFYGCSGLTGSIPNNIFKYNVLTTNVTYAFSGCSGLTGAIPNLFATNTLITTYVNTFSGCTGLTSIPVDLFRYSGSATLSFDSTFYNCTGITSIPPGLFDYNINVTSFASTFRNTRITTIPSNLFVNNTKVTSFSYTFATNPSLAAIPSNLFDTNTLVTTFNHIFNDCTGVTSIPTDLFRYNVVVTNMSGVFNNTRITAIPIGLFANNPLVTSFASTFANIGATNKLSLDADLFRYNPEVTTFANTFQATNVTLTPGLFYYNTKVTTFASTFYSSVLTTTSETLPSNFFDTNVLVTSFYSTFSNCGGLTGSIPVDFFRYNTLVTNFDSTFNLCINLTGAIPVDLFRYNLEVITFGTLTSLGGVFRSCYRLDPQIPEDLFYYNTKVTSYYGVFALTRNIVLPTRLFNAANLGKVTTWQNFLNVTQTSYSPTGSIQKIWDVSEGGDVTYTVQPTKTDAFNNCTALSNYAEIPTAWT